MDHYNVYYYPEGGDEHHAKVEIKFAGREPSKEALWKAAEAFKQEGDRGIWIKKGPESYVWEQHKPEWRTVQYKKHE